MPNMVWVLCYKFGMTLFPYSTLPGQAIYVPASSGILYLSTYTLTPIIKWLKCAFLFGTVECVDVAIQTTCDPVIFCCVSSCVEGLFLL